MQHRSCRILVRSGWLLIGSLMFVALLLAWGAGTAVAQSVEPVSIPLSQTAPDVDGTCTSFKGEYDDAAAYPFTDAFAFTGTVYLKRDTQNIYVCMVGANSSNSEKPYAAVYLDTDNGKEAIAENDDIGLRVTLPGATSGGNVTSAVRGDGAGGYAADPTVTGWNAAASTVDTDQAEWQIPIELVTLNLCNKFGIAVYHQGFDVRPPTPADYGWPSGEFFYSPKTWQEAQLGSNPCSGKIAYVYRIDAPTAGNFKTFLESRGFSVQLIPMATVLATNFSGFDLVIIADDTGNLSNWPQGIGGVSPQANHIRSFNQPMMGLGEGGYAYFGKHGQEIGWPNGWHGPLDRVSPRNVGQPYWQTPTSWGVAPPDPFPVYNNPLNEVGIYLPAVSGVIEYGVEPSSTDHAPLIVERAECSQLWGFSGRPAGMTPSGQDLFVNAVVFGIGQQCPEPPQPPADCVTLEKTAIPAHNTLVSVGAVIRYTIKYTVKNDPLCALQRAILEDKVPERTLFIPGSASDGIAPGADDVLRWNVGPLAPAATGEKKFAVRVADSICNGQRVVNNQARMVTSLGVFTSNLVSHPVDCPPVVPAGNEPPYAEDEIQIYPYPLITGHSTELSVRIRNLRPSPQTVRVTFETSPNNFGIGIPFGTLPAAGNPRIVTLPANGIVEVKLNWIPVTSGHYCIRVKIESIGSTAYPPLYTYRNLDVMENLQAGVTDTLTFSVGNPTAAVATVNLLVVNTCPGWVASVSPTELINMAPGEVRQATLSVTPPTDRPLGTACHIDVQGWIGDLLIGGIRKLDVPPVHLPPSNPPWMEKEIVFLPDPPVLNQQGQVCIQLQNPMPFPRTVSVDFAWAAFGAGIGFTPIGSLNNIVLPANSFAQYCVNWTPTPVANGNLHRCIQVTLRQAGFEDQRSQRNVDLRRLTIGSLSELLQLQIPFTVGNTREFTAPLQIDPVLVGLMPNIRPKVTPDPPPFLGPGAAMNFTLGFFDVAGASANAAGVAALDDALTEGDTSRVEVYVYLDDELEGGFSVEFATTRVFLPTVLK